MFVTMKKGRFPVSPFEIKLDKDVVFLLQQHSDEHSELSASGLFCNNSKNVVDRLDVTCLFIDSSSRVVYEQSYFEDVELSPGAVFKLNLNCVLHEKVLATIGRNLTTAITVTAYARKRSDSFEIELSSEAFHPCGPVDPKLRVGVASYFDAGLISAWKTDPDYDKDVQVITSAVITIFRKDFVPLFLLEAKLFDKSGKELADLSTALQAFSPSGPRLIRGGSYVKERLLKKGSRISGVVAGFWPIDSAHTSVVGTIGQ
jgi:hypothetical protein